MTDTDRHRRHLERAAQLSLKKMEAGHGGPFGAVIARGDEVIAEGWNRVTSTNDPTAHAEMEAIRAAAAALGRFNLSGLTLYSSCEPCPMCRAAAHWARLDGVFYANDAADAARIGFDDADIAREVAAPPGAGVLPMIRIPLASAREAFDAWARKSDKIPY